MIVKMSSKGKLTLPPAARKALSGSIVSEKTLNARKQLAELRCVSHIGDVTTPGDTEWDAERDTWDGKG